jgi:hypothetical protein
MVRKLEDFATALVLGGIIKALDELVFKEKTTKVKVVDIKPKENEAFVRYQPEEDYYEIDGYIDDIVVKQARMYRHFPFEMLKEGKDRLKEWYKFPPYSEIEYLISLAAHEVRHRVQCKLSVTVFSLENALDAKDPYLKGLIKFVEMCFKKEPLTSKYTDKEFDAKIIFWLTGKILQKNGNLSEIALIIQEDAKNLLRKNYIVNGVFPVFIYFKFYFSIE